MPTSFTIKFTFCTYIVHGLHNLSICFAQFVLELLQMRVYNMNNFEEVVAEI